MEMCYEIKFLLLIRGGQQLYLNDRSRSDCVHEQVAKRIANVRFTLRMKKLIGSDPIKKKETFWCLRSKFGV